MEIGPKEADGGTAIVARANAPGTVARKKSVNVAVQLVREVQAALKEVSFGGGQMRGPERRIAGGWSEAGGAVGTGGAGVAGGGEVAEG